MYRVRRPIGGWRCSPGRVRSSTRSMCACPARSPTKACSRGLPRPSHARGSSTPTPRPRPASCLVVDDLAPVFPPPLGADSPVAMKIEDGSLARAHSRARPPPAILARTRPFCWMSKVYRYRRHDRDPRRIAAILPAAELASSMSAARRCIPRRSRLCSMSLARWCAKAARSLDLNRLSGSPSSPRKWC